jgi:hypothetical protein
MQPFFPEIPLIGLAANLDIRLIAQLATRVVSRYCLKPSAPGVSISVCGYRLQPFSHYSSRKAMIGSIAAARRAGIQLDKRAIAAIDAVVTPKTKASLGLTP